MDGKSARKIAVIGTGYVGMASAIGLAELGHDVAGYDIDLGRVRLLQQGLTPYREAGIHDPLQRQLAGGRLAFYTTLESALAQAEFIIVCVGTPSSFDGSCDLSSLESAIESLVPVAASQAIIVLRSTVPPGTTARMQARHPDLRLIYAPEFLREGAALADFLNPARIVVGGESDDAATAYLALFEDLHRPSVITGSREAELIKGCSNAYLAMKVAFANQVASLCDVVEADALAVLRGVGADPRIGAMFLQPGIGFGGPCFEKDVKSLAHFAQQHGVGNELFAATLSSNDAQPDRILQGLIDESGALAGLHVGVWGMAFKAGTDDTRDSMAIRIIQELLRRGAIVSVYDPEVDARSTPVGARFATSALEAAEADVLLILTEWPEFAEVDVHALASAVKRRIVYDGRNVLSSDACEAAGLNYRGFGRKLRAKSSIARRRAAAIV